MIEQRAWLKDYILSQNLIKVNKTYDELKDFRMDTNFIILRVNHQKKRLELGVVSPTPINGKYIITHIFYGKKPQDIYFYLSKTNLINLKDHFSYIGKELQKAYVALKQKTKYVQE